MEPLKIWRAPPRPESGMGRIKIIGTILIEPDESDKYVLVRNCWDEGGKLSNIRAGLWVAIAESDRLPLLVRGSGRRSMVYPYCMPVTEWQRLQGWHEVGARIEEAFEAVQMSVQVPHLQASLVGAKTARSVHEFCVPLPGDDRAKYHPAAVPTIDELLRLRTICPDDEVWAIDAQILCYTKRDYPERQTPKLPKKTSPNYLREVDQMKSISSAVIHSMRNEISQAMRGVRRS
jgi:hypothetical protein